MGALFVVLTAAGGAIVGFLAGGVVAPEGDPRSAAFRALAAVIGGLGGGAVPVLTVATDRRPEKP
jgi:hypothetical protein